MARSVDIRLRAEDGVALSGVHVAGPDPCFVVAHGFTGRITRPSTQRIIGRLASYGGVLAVDFRGHGASAGQCTLGNAEVADIAAAVRYARKSGYERVVTVGFSMGGSVVIRYAGTGGDTDAVVSVSGPARWFERRTHAMRRVHWLCESGAGRLLSPWVAHTRLGSPWDPVPPSPVELVGAIAPTPLLIVHGDADRYFPLDHPRALYAAAGPGAQLWLEAGMGHAESATDPALLGRIAAWSQSLNPADPSVIALSRARKGR